MGNEGTFYAVAQLPYPWPVKSKHVIVTTNVDRTVVDLIAQPDGSLAMEISTHNDDMRLETFQRIELVGTGAVVLTCSWTISEASLRVNGRELQRGDPQTLPLLSIPVGGGPGQPTLIFPEIEINNGRTEEERLFLARIQDLDHRGLGGDWYSLLNAAAMLRQLLLDGLVHRVNHSHAKLLFRTNQSLSSPPPAYFEFEVCDPGGICEDYRNPGVVSVSHAFYFDESDSDLEGER